MSDTTIARFEATKHEDLFAMGGKALREESKGRTARAKAAKAELERRAANRLAKGQKPLGTKTPKPKAAAKPKVQRGDVKPAAGGGGQVARARAAK